MYHRHLCSINFVKQSSVLSLKQQRCRARNNRKIGRWSKDDDNASDNNVTNLHIQQWWVRSFPRFARPFLVFVHFATIPVLSWMWNDLFCSCVDYISIWWQTLNLFFRSSDPPYKFSSSIVSTYFETQMIWNSPEMITVKLLSEMTFSLLSEPSLLQLSNSSHWEFRRAIAQPFSLTIRGKPQTHLLRFD